MIQFAMMISSLQRKFINFYKLLKLNTDIIEKYLILFIESKSFNVNIN